MVTQNSALTASVLATSTGCGTSAIGTATVTASGGTGYTYHWNNGQSDSTASNLVAGNYSVTVTDAAGCTATATATVAQGNNTLAASTTVTNVTCNGLTNGDVDLTVSGGTINYAYNWSGGTTSQNLTGVPAGNYTVTVTDAHSCTATASATVTQPSAVVATPSVVNAGCGLSSSGSASVAVSGGSGAYTYLWSNTQTTDTILNLSGGTYTVTVTDAHSCTATAAAIVSNSGALSVTTNPTPASCYGASNGSASVNVTGGTGNITYTWTGGASGPTISNLPAGTYTVTVSDTGGCTNVSTQVVTQPDSIAISLISSPAACGASNGSVSASVSGGTLGYLYHWNTGAATPAISGLSGGNYSVTVTDAHTCTAVSTTAVTSNSSLIANLIASNVTCNGAANGSASAIVSTGTSPYTYLWNNGGTSNLISNLTAGTYAVTITDSLGCHSIDSVTVNQPSALVIIINASQPTCNGQSTGSASLTVSGGAGNYSYAWPNGSTSSSVSGLLAGNYTITVSDGNGCSATSGLTINTVPTLGTSFITLEDSCYGGQNGTAEVTASGGSGAYTYSWNNGDTTGVIGALAAGTYTVSVTDNQGCSAERFRKYYPTGSVGNNKLLNKCYQRAK